MVVAGIRMNMADVVDDAVWCIVLALRDNWEVLSTSVSN